MNVNEVKIGTDGLVPAIVRDAQLARNPESGYAMSIRDVGPV